MNIYNVFYLIKHKRNGNPVMSTHAIIVANDKEEAETIYKKNHHVPEDKILRVSQIGDENSKGEIYSF